MTVRGMQGTSLRRVVVFHHCVAGSYLVVSYSAWRVHPALWILDQVRNDVTRGVAHHPVD